MASLKQLEKRIKIIENRNKKVESEKSWETSFSRRAIIFLLTYLSIAVYMWAVNLPTPFLNAIVPSVAFMLSTMTLPFFKDIWERFIYKK